MAGASTYHGNSSCFRNRFEHQVFLSFRGEDVRRTFVDHLYDALKGSGFKVFKDNVELEHGEDIQSKLYQAIERSQLSIVTLSKRYADSRWCLDELVKIMGCRFTHGHTVLPVFYDVEPTHVRNQSGPYEEAFKAHEVRFRGEIGRVNNWKLALKQMAELKGMASTDDDRYKKKYTNFTISFALITNLVKLGAFGDQFFCKLISSRYESRFIQNIVRAVRKILDPRRLYVPPYIVGTYFIVEEISDWLRDGSQCVELGIIYGLGGTGKTTISKIAYNNNLDKFDGCSFIEGFNELSMQGNGVPLLLEQLMADISGKRPDKVYNIDKGIVDVIAVLRNKRILLVLDNVDSSTKIHMLLQVMSSFYPGSKVIITSINKVQGNYALLMHEFQVHPLGSDEATSVFCQHAFGKDVPSDNFKSIVNSLVEYCGGFPLALKVLALSLGGLKSEMWESQLAKLESFPKRDLLDTLKLSFDSLEDDNDKDIFLHVALFLVGMQKDHAIQILESCELHPRIGLENLNNRCLVTVDCNDRLTMHHLVKEMGKYVVRLEDPREPGKRSRLWCPKEAFRVLRNNEGTTSIKGLCLEFPMSLTDSYTRQSSKRSSWLGFFQSTPPSVTQNSRTVRTNAFTNMKNMNLLQIHNILLEGGFRDFPKAIKWLRWNGCTLKSLPLEFDLYEVVVLEMCNSRLVHAWEAGKFLEELRVLNLSHSHHLVDTPDFSLAPKLEWMSFEDCVSQVEIHKSIGSLTKLTHLNFKGCINLRRLPDGIYKLLTLEVVNLSGCPCLSIVQNILGWRSQTTSPYRSFNVFESLRELRISNCGISQDDIFNYLCGCSSLQELDLSGNPITVISGNVGSFTRLRRLVLDDCTKLRSVSLSILPRGSRIHCMGCISLERISCDRRQRPYLVLDSYCPKLMEIEGLVKFEVTRDMDAELARYMGYSGLESLDGVWSKGVYSLRHGIYSACLHGDHTAKYFTTVLTGVDYMHYIVPLQPNCAIRAINLGYMFNHDSNGPGFVEINNRTCKWTYWDFYTTRFDVSHLNSLKEKYPCEMTFLSHWCVLKRREVRPGDELLIYVGAFGSVQKFGIQIIYEDVEEDKLKNVNWDNNNETTESHGCMTSTTTGESMSNVTGSESEENTRANNKNVADWYTNTFRVTYPHFMREVTIRDKLEDKE